MRDKNNEAPLSQSFIQDSWEEMEAILDKEMPVKRKKGFLWIPLSTAAALLLLVGLNFWWTSAFKNNSSSIAQQEKNIAPSNSTSIISTSETNIENNTNENSYSSKEAERSLAKLNLPASSPQQKNDKIYNEIEGNQLMKNGETPLKSNLTLNSNQDLSLTENLAFEKNTTSTNPKSNAPQIPNRPANLKPKENIIATAPPASSILAFIEQKKTPQVYSKKSLAFPNGTFTQSTAIQTLATKRWKTSVASGTLLRMVKHDGFYTDFNIERKIAPKWSLFSGLSYAFFNTNDKAQMQGSELLNERYVELADQDFNSSLPESTFPNLHYKGNHHLLRLPLGISYQVSPRFQFKAAAALSYRVNSLRMSFDNTPDFVNTPILNEENSLSLNKLTNRLSQNIGVGASYQFLPKLSINMTYTQNLNFGKTDLERFLSRGGANQYWQVGIGYHFQ